jgi:hypothetical protein
MGHVIDLAASGWCCARAEASRYALTGIGIERQQL